MIRMTKAVKHLLIINVLLFLAKYVLRSRGIDLDAYLALSFPKNELFEPWQLVTHMFMHANEMHILFNMLALWMFGSAVEGILGTKRFLILYFIAGIGAFSLHLGYNYYEYSSLMNRVDLIGLNDQVLDVIAKMDIIKEELDGRRLYTSELLFEKIRLSSEISLTDKTQIFSSQENITTLFEFNVMQHDMFISKMLGASGAIMGILAAFGMLLPNAELMLIFLPIPIKAKYFIPGIILLDVFSFFTGVSIFSPSNTAFLAHIGGAITGFIVMMLWKKRNKTYYY